MLFVCLCFFFFFFNSIGIRLKLHTYGNVLQALHALEIKNPNVLLNIPKENKKGRKKIPKDLIPGSPDSTKYLHIKMSKECLLRHQQDGKVMEKILFEKSKVYIKTPDKNNHCSYQAVLTSLHQYISDLEGFHKYTAVYLKYHWWNKYLPKHGTKLCVPIHALKHGYSSFYTVGNGVMPNPCWVLSSISGK